MLDDIRRNLCQLYRTWQFPLPERAGCRDAGILILLELDARILFAPELPVLFPLPVRTILARIDFSPNYNFLSHFATVT